MFKRGIHYPGFNNRYKSRGYGEYKETPDNMTTLNFHKTDGSIRYPDSVGVICANLGTLPKSSALWATWGNAENV